MGVIWGGIGSFEDIGYVVRCRYVEWAGFGGVGGLFRTINLFAFRISELDASDSIRLAINSISELNLG